MMRNSLILIALLFICLPCSGLNGPGAFAADEPANASGKRPKVGLVLSGGGAKGFAYIGLLRVIEEVGLPIDYIGGSSIGSIIGGLYALGYAPDTIAKIIRTQPWDDLLKDIAERKYKSFEEKEYGEKTVVRLPIRNRKISVDAAMYQGQEIDLLLNYYFSPAYRTTDFSKLPIPFLCMGTNLFTGEQVILDSGYLPMAIRSSMSIPGYFAPTDYNGYFLVDGGVVNNYPVKEVRDMGAEIIIGGDVQSGLYTTREQLKSITAVLDQITSYPRIASNKVADSLTDLKVKYKMTYGMMDFDQYDSIMAYGERVAREHYDAIKKLADSLNAIEPVNIRSKPAVPLDSVWVDSLVITGKNKMPRYYFSSLFRRTSNTWISMKDLQSNIRTMYGSGFFERVSYTFEQRRGKTFLVIDANEGGPGALSAGIHFDNDYGVGVILSAEFKNILISNSKLFVDLNLSLNPRIRGVYLHGLGGKAAIGLRADFYSFNFDQYNQEKKVNTINFRNNLGSVFFRYTFRNLMNLQAGFEYEYFRFSQDIESDTSLEKYQQFKSYGTAFVSLAVDSRDKPYFTNRGVAAQFRGEYVMPLSKDWATDFFTNAGVFYLKYNQYIPLSRRFVLNPGMFAGASFYDINSPPPQHLFGAGGLSYRNYLDQVVPFAGLDFIQKYGSFEWILRAKLQYNVFRKLYATPRIDIGAVTNEFDQLFRSKNLLCGYGLTAGYDSFIGPVELTLMGSNLNPGVMLFVNIGFCF